jgi:hypothetical protein
MSNEKFKTVKWVLKGIRMTGNLRLVKKAKKRWNGKRLPIPLVKRR